MIVIGITGPTGAGKTTALRQLEQMGGYVLDADKVYHNLLASSVELKQALTDRFGVEILDENNQIDRKKLGSLVFQDAVALEELNTISHHHVVAEIAREIEKARSHYPVAAIDAIGLFESGADQICDTTLAVVAPPEIRVERIMAREGISREYAQSRVSAQKSDEFYTTLCEHVLENNCATSAEFGEKARDIFELIFLKEKQ